MWALRDRREAGTNSQLREEAGANQTTYRPRGFRGGGPNARSPLIKINDRVGGDVNINYSKDADGDSAPNKFLSAIVIFLTCTTLAMISDTKHVFFNVAQREFIPPLRQEKN